MTCKLCKRNKHLSLIYDFEKDELNFKGYDEEICDACNLVYKFTNFKRCANEIDIKKIILLLDIKKFFNKYFEDEIRIQQNQCIKLWKNDKYFNDFIKKKIKSTKNKKLLKDSMLLYYDNFANLSTSRIKYKGDKHLYIWVFKNYYFLKNGVKW